MFAEAYNNRELHITTKASSTVPSVIMKRPLEINPKFAKAYYNRGMSIRTKGEYDSAISDYNKAIELDPKFADAYYNQGLPIRAKASMTAQSLITIRRVQANRPQRIKGR